MKKTLFCFFLLSASAYAQERTVSSGNEGTGSGGTTSGTVGLIDYNYYSSSSGSISEGVQQTFTISSSSVDTWDLNYVISVFPNPTTMLLNISSQSTIVGAQSELFDNNGQLVLTQPLSGEQTTLDLSELATGTYFLNIKVQDKPIRVYTILKNN